MAYPDYITPSPRSVTDGELGSTTANGLSEQLDPRPLSSLYLQRRPCVHTETKCCENVFAPAVATAEVVLIAMAQISANREAATWHLMHDAALLLGRG